MKTVLIMFLTAVFLTQSVEAIDRKLIDAIIKTESNNKSFIIGDNGKAYGKLQIHKGVIKDVNRIYKTSYTHSDAFKHDKAVTIAVLYLKHTGRRYERLYGKPVSNEVYAKIWNCGLNNIRSHKAERYWLAVRKNMYAQI